MGHVTSLSHYSLQGIVTNLSTQPLLMGSETEGDILDKMPADEFSNLNRREQDPLSQANGWHKALVLLTEV